METTITIYHGSQYVIEKPIFGEGNPRNDYGLGFYCTHDIGLAKEWACTSESSGYANIYELDTSELITMHLSGGEFNILNWLAILLKNRTFNINNDIAVEGYAYLIDNFLPDINLIDLIIGYRADDSYFSFANAFLNNTLSLEQLENAMYLGKLGEQTVIISEKGFSHIKFIGSEFAERDVFFPMKTSRDSEARLAYRRGRAQRRASDSTYLIDILREGWSNDDERIRRNVSG
ncbi:MAG: DUF3990 domain-containing protein [Oscillospiraceae bacterium]|nr:DUF3990 domain-containing protein [Oscillospiraceae bacterium]